MILFINYYKDKYPQRQAELDFCLQKNIENEYIDSIVAFHDENTTVPDLPKLIPVLHPVRPAYGDYFRLASNFTGIKMLSNSDIYFDETVRYCNEIRKGEVFVLCRYEQKNGELKFYNNGGSQDVWVWKGDINLKVDFTLGTVGCDNRLAFLLYEAGFKLRSPSLSIHSIHLHNTHIRHYDFRNKIQRPYLVVNYHTIEDRTTEVIQNILWT